VESVAPLNCNRAQYLHFGLHKTEQFGVSSWKQQHWRQAPDDDECRICGD